MSTQLKKLIKILKKKSNPSYNNIIKIAESYIDSKVPGVFIDISELKCLIDPEECQGTETTYGITIKKPK